jgi:hypothetical protein
MNNDKEILLNEEEEQEQEEVIVEQEDEEEANLLARLQEAEARAARLEAEAQRQRDEDFKRKLESVPPEERIKLELEYERSKRQEIELKLMRNEIRSEYPLFAGILEIFSSRFQIELDSADELRQIAEAIGPQLNALLKDQISTEKTKVRKEAIKKWGIQGTTSSVSGVPEGKSAAQIRYDAVKEQFEKDPTNPVLLQKMIAAKRELSGR